MASPRSPFVCSRCARSLRINNGKHAARPFATSTTNPRAASTPSAEDLPRWRQTPPAMKMPLRLRPRPKQPEWKVNDKQEPLDEMYDRFIGAVAKSQGQNTRGRDLLPEEVKWLAITHKSYEHGKQGFNDKLAFLGKRILDLHTSLALLNQPPAPSSSLSSRDVYRHPATEGAENITAFARAQVLSPPRLAQLATGYGLDKVVRWKPRKTDNLQSSGMDVVLAHATYSIIGALALTRGGEVAARMARERVLQPLGLR